jgi:hypothetical protein
MLNKNIEEMLLKLFDDNLLEKQTLIKELGSLSGAVSSIVLMSNIVQNEFIKMMVEVNEGKLKDGGILKHRVKNNRDTLEVVFSNFNELVRVNWEREMSSGDV